MLEPARRQDVYWATRLTLCGTADDARRFDAVFDAYFGERPGTITRRQQVLTPRLQLVSTDDAALPEPGQPPARTFGLA